MTITVSESLASEIRRCGPYRRLQSRLGRVERLPAAAAAWILGLLREDLARPLLVILPHEAQVLDFIRAAELLALAAELFEAPSLTPYQATAPSVAVCAHEVAILDRLLRGEAKLVAATPRALFRALPSREEFSESVLEVHVGEELGRDELLRHFETFGYSRRDLVTDIGEYAVRGGIVDCYPPGASQPLRVEYFGDRVETLRAFDPDDQRSKASVDSARIPPVMLFARPGALPLLARELAGDELGYEATRAVEAAERGEGFAGWENYLPLLAPKWSTIVEWLGEGVVTAVVEPEASLAEILRHARHLEDDLTSCRESGRLSVAPERLQHPEDRVRRMIACAQIRIDEMATLREPGVDFGATLTDVFHDQIPRFPAEVEAARDRGERVVVVTGAEDQRSRIERLCEHYSLPKGRGGIEFIEGDLERGFRLPPARVSVFAEAQLFRRPPPVRRRRPGFGPFLASLRDLRVGDYVVHEDHGIGQFMGLRTVGPDDGDEAQVPPSIAAEAVRPLADAQEVLEIRYGDGRTLLLPPSRLDLIQRFAATEGVVPRLDRLGGTSWARAKERVRSGVRRLAVDLLKLYAQRSMARAPRILADSDLQRQFEAAFEYEPTADQIEAIAEIKADLESERPMDRLLCGDVGFGKTEVAMRAAFKVVDGGFQVVVLAPTTILADQHFETFGERFAEFPVVVEMVSRFRSDAEIRKIRERVMAGGVDILVGTHRLLSRDIELPRLGLLIVDEEQRFGVAQKERLKELKKNVHVLALTATPVPRTLQLSLAGVRDLSTIETPPRDRQAVETAIVPFSDELIREAVEYEIDRGGQVYYVFNRVAGIAAMAARLQELCGEVRLVVGHGQLEEAELAKRMHEFKAGKHDLLLATTIIENGIDIPNVNTIFVHRADRFGLAQLYQLRGRVGRSRQLAYCYLLVPKDRSVSERSRKRLHAIREFTELGAGFRVAARDLEIRGAGDLLGAEQSGHISAVGIETYMKLLEETVRELKGEAPEAPVSTAINLPVTAAIPEAYVGNTNIRLDLYRRVARGLEPRQGREMLSELEDRFGTPPETVHKLIDMSMLRRRAEAIRVQSISGRGTRLQIRFRHDTSVSSETLIRFVGETAFARFSPTGVLTVDGVEAGDWIATTAEILEALSP